ncbi:hypothetical protein HK096_010995 [Nowakowskiella sp. JEL0078]|nr:hypothetical protein HK096_010995 [Nowakowskiella sp. JEL0078]
MLFKSAFSLAVLAIPVFAGTLTVISAAEYQIIDGFGGMDGWTYMENADIDTAFSSSLGLTILRVRVSDNTNDWANIAKCERSALN